MCTISSMRGGTRSFLPVCAAAFLSIIPPILAQYAQPSHFSEESLRLGLARTSKIKRQNNQNSHRKVHRRDGSTWCEGTCTNLVLCSIQGGSTVQDSSCKGYFSVCCVTKPVKSSPAFPASPLVRVPRQLAPYTVRVTRPGPWKARVRRPKSLPKPPGPPPSQRQPSAESDHRGIIKNPEPTSLFASTGARTSSSLLKTSADQSRWPALTDTQEQIVQDKWQNSHTSELQNEIPQDSGVNQFGCGLSQTVAEERILGGQDAGFGQFPWTALIQIKGHQLDKMCAGTLVNNRFILTAGHCVQYCGEGLLPNCSRPIPFSELTFKVVLGEYDVNNKYKESTIQRYHATDIYIHPQFTNIFRLRDNNFLESEPRHDVALLKLDRYVKPAPNIGSICLPPISLYLEPGTLATVTGWGRLGVHQGAPHSSTLQAVTVPVLTRQECAEQPGASIPTDDQLCGGLSNSRQSSCPGDSGGGLMVRDEDYRWSIIGIVSTGPSECGLTPVIYHNVLSSIGWVQSTMQQAGGGRR